MVKKLPTNGPQSSKTSSEIVAEMGYCIRCAIAIPFDRANPLCSACYESWNKYKNRNYQERFCHSCGEEEKTSVEHPFCKSCVRQRHK
jgi:NMD protein affecting ribosome stability and mRNA decay